MTIRLSLLACGLVAVLLSGCGLTGGKRPETVGSLPSAPAPVEEGAEEASRMRAIGAYQQYLNSADPDDPMRAEAMRRLADLRRAERERRELEATGEPIEEVGDFVPLYEALVKRFPDHERADQVRYQLARAYESQGKTLEALNALDTLVESHPDSALAVEAQFRRGELLFVNRSYREATEAYRAVIAYGDASPYYHHSQYKLGWSHYKLSEYPETLEAFTASLDEELGRDGTPLEELPRAQRERIEDSLRAMSLSFIAEGGNEAVARFYAEHGVRGYEDIVFDHLAQTYLAKEQYTDAAETYRLFASRNPLHRRAPEFDHQAIEALGKGGFGKLVLEAKVDFIDRYGLDGAYWQQYDPAERPEVVARLKSNLTDVARHYHAVAQASKKPADYAAAQRWYASFVSWFPNEPETPGMHFLLAEVTYESGQYAAAVDAYEFTAYRYPLHARSAEAGYAALLAYGKAEPRIPADRREAWERRRIESALLFEAAFSGHQYAAPVLTQAGEDLYRLGDPGRARAAGERLLERYPEAPADLQLTAWTLVGHSSFDLGDYARAEEAYAVILARLTPAQQAEQGPKLRERLAASVYKQGEAARDAGDLRTAANHFLRVGQRVPDAELRPTAEYDAAAALLTLEAWGEASRVLEDFRRRYPNHALRPEVDRRLAAAYLKDGNALKAAGMYEVLAGSAADPALQRQSLEQAAELYKGAGATQEEARVLRGYIQSFPSPLEPAIEARQRLADLSLEAGDKAGYHRWLEALVDAERKGATERTDRTRYLAGTALIVLAEPKADAYRQVRLVEPIKQNLKTKKDRLETAIDAYGEAVDYGLAEVVTAATYHIADLYYDFSQALINSERPKGLDELELEQYEILLEEQAFPFEEKAISVHEINMQRIPEGVYDEWTRKSLSQLARLLPVRYNKTERNVSLVHLNP